jgi:hypothetical protein
LGFNSIHLIPNSGFYSPGFCVIGFFIRVVHADDLNFRQFNRLNEVGSVPPAAASTESLRPFSSSAVVCIM